MSTPYVSAAMEICGDDLWNSLPAYKQAELCMNAKFEEMNQNTQKEIAQMKESTAQEIAQMKESTVQILKKMDQDFHIQIKKLELEHSTKTTALSPYIDNCTKVYSMLHSFATTTIGVIFAIKLSTRYDSLSKVD